MVDTSGEWTDDDIIKIKIKLKLQLDLTKNHIHNKF